MLQISLISLLMDCPAPASVSGWGGSSFALYTLFFSLRDMPSLGCTSNYPSNSSPSFIPIFCLVPTVAAPEGRNTKRSVSQREANSFQLGYPAQCALGQRCALHCPPAWSLRRGSRSHSDVPLPPRRCACVKKKSRVHVRVVWCGGGGGSASQLQHAGPVGFSQCVSQRKGMTS